MIQRVMPDLMGMKNVMVLNDEAHHCYREKPPEADDVAPTGDDRKEAEENNEAARLWISGLEAVNRKLGVTRIVDLAATPFFLRGSGYAEGTLFPWTMSDFSLMDAIECGIVKRPRVPVAENIPGNEMPVYRNLWEHIRKDMPKSSRGKGDKLDPLKLATRLQTALQALYGHYEQTFNLWKKSGISVPPCFIIVCQNTAISKLVDDYVSGFQRQNDNGTTTLENGRLALFRNFDETTATFTADSILELTPDLVGPTKNENAGIIGETATLTVEHLGDVRPSTLLFHLTHRLLYTKWRDPGEEPKLHLFGQLKRITKQWLDGYLVCKGGTYPALLMYQELADIACNRITAGITRALEGSCPIKALLDPYNPTATTTHVRFNTSKELRWETNGPPPKNHVNWVILDSEWEAEFCRVAEKHPQVVAYTKNHNLGFEVPYRYGSETRRYRPDFIVHVDDGHGPEDLLNLVIEIKGYRKEDAKEKKSTMDTYWVPGVNHLKTYGRWAFAEFCDVYEIESDFEAKVAAEFEKLIDSTIAPSCAP
jgi:hypothetical protein